MKLRTKDTKPTIDYVWFNERCDHQWMPHTLVEANGERRYTIRAWCPNCNEIREAPTS